MGSPEKPLDVEMGDMSEEAKLNPDVKTEQVVIKENGGGVNERFTGLKKEELMKISSEPKWVRARWILFILFWLIWLAMLVGAILIVVNAPRCKPKPEPMWYQDTVVYEVDAKEFAGGLEGMKEHLPYVISNLHAETIVLSGQSDMIEDPNFSTLVTAIQDKGKIIIDVEVDSLPTSNPAFIESASASCAAQESGDNCDLFMWKNQAEVMDGWKYNDQRKGIYKVTESDQALINYSGSSALPYIKDVLRKWFKFNVNGVKIRDIAKLENITQKLLVEELWNDVFKNDTERALFVHSSNPDAELNPELLETNESNTVHSPVFLTGELASAVNQNEAGMKIAEIINKWRAQSRNIGGFMVSPVGMELAATRFPGFAAGFNLLSMALPGVPILRSGDELAATSPVFTWTDVDMRDSYPLNGSDAILQQTKTLIVGRIEGIQSKESLRFDTRDNDTSLNFLDVGNNDIVAFKRKWDKKGAVLVVSNLSPTNYTDVNLAVAGGLMNAEDKLAKTANVLVTSLPSSTGESVDLDKVKLDSGATLVLEA